MLLHMCLLGVETAALTCGAVTPGDLVKSRAEGGGAEGKSETAGLGADSCVCYCEKVTRVTLVTGH